MPPLLTALKHPISLRPEHVAPEQTRLRIKQHSKSWSGGDFTIFAASSSDASTSGSSSSPLTDGAKLFTVDGKVTSWSQRTSMRDATGLPLFEMYRKKAGVTWYVGLPGSADRDEAVVKMMPRFSLLKDKVDVVVSNAADGGSEVLLEVRGQDVWKLNTFVFFEGALVMRLRRTDKMSVYVPGKSMEWEVDVAQGMDLSLVSPKVMGGCNVGNGMLTEL
ncbi:hypothetical protein M8818_005371 [Zalaria obscura]|uniref:Uncharacterized protein n=1 Tax=Zalaria obscura TaxID=2024903 RepID=A0ACC3SA17_9PEZI